MSGRVTAIEAVASDPEEVWVGTASGGLWHSTDGALTFEPRFDEQPVTSIGAIAVFQARPDLVWVGTGEGNPRNSSTGGRGVFRSRDRGHTWERLGLEETDKIHRILVHPEDPDRVWVAALGQTWGENEERGVFRTTDGGRSWDRILFVDPRTGCADLVMDPQNPDHLLAAMWEHRRWPWFFRSGGPGSGLYETWDGGDTWNRQGPEEGLPSGELGRIGLAFAPSDPSIVYALVEAERSVLLRSENGGRSWRTVNRDPGVANRPFYYADLRVDPADPNRLYNLASTVTVSSDGGRSFETLIPWSLIHPDHHAMWIHPRDPNLIYEGNDGGMAVSRDRGRTWRFVRNLPLAQYYHIAVDDDLPYHVYGGMQDNGSWRGPSEVWENGGIRNHHWEEVGFGDGFDTRPDPEDSLRGYAMSQEGWLLRWDLRTGERKDIRPPAPEGVELRFHWNAAFAQDPFHPATLYYGSQFVHVSPDRGETWRIISPDLTSNDPEKQRQAESGGLTLDVTGAENHTTLITIAPSPVRHEVIWAGSDDGRIHVTRDNGATWERVDPNLPGVPPSTWVAQITASRFDAATAYACLDNHRRADWTPYVFVTRDYGRSWTSLASADLDGYCLSLVEHGEDPRILFLGTELGLYASLDAGHRWFRWPGMPSASCMDLAWQDREADLVIGTFGRSAWVIDDLRFLPELDAAVTRSSLHLFAVSPARQHRIKQTGASRFPGSGEFRGENPPYGAVFTFWAGPEEESEAGAGDGDSPDGGPEERKVEVRIRDAAGEPVRRFQHPVRSGLNRVVWNLRADDLAPLPEPEDPFGLEREDPPPGLEVPPGRYEVQLVLGEEIFEAGFEVLGDPRYPGDAGVLAERSALARRIVAVQERLAKGLQQIYLQRADLGLALERLRTAKRLAEREDGEAPASLLALLEQGERLEEAFNAQIEAARGPEEPAQGIVREQHLARDLRSVRRGLASTWGRPTERVGVELERVEGAARAWSEVTRGLLERDLLVFRARFEEAGPGLFDWPLRD